MAETYSAQTGFVALAVAVASFGSFGIFMKDARLKAIPGGLDPLLFQMYLSTSVALFSSLVMLVLPPGSVHLTLGAVGSAFCWMPASLCTVFAVRLLGLGVAQGVWSGLGLLVSFVWGALLARSADGVLHSAPLAAVSVVALVAAIMALSLVPTSEQGGEAEDVFGDSEELLGGGAKAGGHARRNGLLLCLLCGSSGRALG